MTRYGSCGTPPTHVYGVDHTRPIVAEVAPTHYGSVDWDHEATAKALLAGDRPDLVVEPDAWREAGAI